MLDKDFVALAKHGDLRCLRFAVFTVIMAGMFSCLSRVLMARTPANRAENRARHDKAGALLYPIYLHFENALCALE
ncbi:MAG: hypothetical protein KA191_02830 [Verrucomicrobia bacterium]|jgi:hypothetical protein|nr:hypothetical protein [Verrucomicrobiota bacterium]